MPKPYREIQSLSLYYASLNKITDSTVAIRANPATGNIIVRNTATGTAAAYDIAAGNTSGQILTPGLAFIATNPWANFAY